MCTLRKLTRLQKAEMMKKDCKLFMQLHHILMVQLLEKYAKQSY